MERIDYQPIGTDVVDIAAVATMVDGVATEVRIYLRSMVTLAAPTTYIPDNALEHEVISRAGLVESVTFASYTLVSSQTLGGIYNYVLDATIA